MTLKMFYQLICREFNNSKPLEYKWTRKDGYWKMSKGFINSGGVEQPASYYLEAIKLQQEIEEESKLKKKVKSKKVITKYKGD